MKLTSLAGRQGLRWSFALLGLMLPMLVGAVDPPIFDPGDKIKKDTGLGTLLLDQIVINIIRWSLTVLGLIAFAFIVYAGFLWIFSAGNTETTKKAQGILRSSIIGLLVILAAYGISSYIFGVVYNATNAP